jgi:hypothetical protein
MPIYGYQVSGLKDVPYTWEKAPEHCNLYTPNPEPGQCPMCGMYDQSPEELDGVIKYRYAGKAIGPAHLACQEWWETRQVQRWHSAMRVTIR